MKRPRSRSSSRAAMVTLAATAGLFALLLMPRAGEARIMDLRAGGRAGGLFGWGTTSGTPDFFDETRGGGVGFELGFKFLVFDLSANFLQVINGGGTVGTLTQFLLATEIDIPVGHTKMSDGHSRQILRPSVGGGFGFGTPGPVDPPLNAAQISNKGLVAQGKFGYEFFLNPFMGFGGEGIFGYHYFIDGQVAANSQDHSSGFHMMLLANFTFHLGF
jgi:hypothetical protein